MTAALGTKDLVIERYAQLWRIYQDCLITARIALLTEYTERGSEPALAAYEATKPWEVLERELR